MQEAGDGISTLRHFVPGYYRAVPPGQKPSAHRSASRYPILALMPVLPGSALGELPRLGGLVNQTTRNDRACALWMSGRNMV
jgi:hypothetical protein